MEHRRRRDARALREILVPGTRVGSRGIRANIIAAGAVPTDFGDGHLRFDHALQDVVIQGTALGRLATPDDIGQLIPGLTTASGHWVTGRRIEAEGPTPPLTPGDQTACDRLRQPRRPLLRRVRARHASDDIAALATA
jgi:hypothetical protein